jgi:hypothetical protein
MPFSVSTIRRGIVDPTPSLRTCALVSERAPQEFDKTSSINGPRQTVFRVKRRPSLCAGDETMAFFPPKGFASAWIRQERAISLRLPRSIEAVLLYGQST